MYDFRFWLIALSFFLMSFQFVFSCPLDSFLYELFCISISLNFKEVSISSLNVSVAILESSPLQGRSIRTFLCQVQYLLASHWGRKLNFSYILSSLNSQSMVVKRTKVGSKHSVCIMFLLFTLLFIYYISFGADWALFLLHYTDHESWKLVCFPCCWFWFSSTSYHFFIHFVFWKTLSRVLKYFF